MKRILFLGALALMLTGCFGNDKDIFEEAITQKVVSLCAEGAKVRMFTIERVDSVTIGEELKYRIHRIESKVSQEEKFYRKYLNERKLVNATKHKESFENAKVSLGKLSGLYESLGSRLEDVAYYVYQFSGEAISPIGDTEFDAFFASLTPQAEVLTISSSRKELRETLCSTIPGYREIIKSKE